MEEIVIRLQEGGPGMLGLAGFAVLTWLVGPLLLGVGFLRRRRLRDAPDAAFSWAPELSALAMLAMAPLLSAVGLRTAVDVVSSLPTDDPSALASELARGISYELNVSTFGAMVTLVDVGFVAPAAGLLFAARCRGRQSATAVFLGGGAALATGSIAVLATGILLRNSAVTRGFAAVATAEPEDKAVLLVQMLDSAAPTLTAAGFVALALLAGAGLVTVLGLAKGQPRLNPKPGSIAFVLGAWLAVAVLAIEAAPFAAENVLPRPRSHGSSFLPLDLPVEVPQLEAPIRTPPMTAVVAVGPGGLWLEGIALEGTADLVQKLEEIRKVDKLMHPSRPENPAILVAVHHVTPMRRVGAVLATLREQRYTDVLVGFRRFLEAQDRPLLGKKTPRAESWLRVRADQGGPSVDFDPDESFEAVARRSIEAARDGAVVWRFASATE